MTPLMKMLLEALDHLEYRTGDPDTDNDEEYDERDGDSSSYELLISDEGCWTVRYYYDGGHAGVTVCVDDHPDDDPKEVARKAVDHARKCAKEASPW